MPSSQPQPPLDRILDRARWAPSGDNTQPWRFELHPGGGLTVHGHDTRDHCVYDLQGHASLIALGALLETIAIASSEHGFRLRTSRRAEAPADRPTFDCAFDHDPSLPPDPLAAFIEQRVTQRRPMTTTPLTDAQRHALQSSLPPGFTASFLGTKAERKRVASLLFDSAHIRLTTPEAFETHRKVIEWNATTSEDRIPDRAVGVDFLTRKLMRWAMQSFGRVTFLNRFLFGTLLPRLQLDYLPGVKCAAHFFLVADKPPASPDDFVAAGRALQRFWLAATQQGLLVQPEMTPLIFTRYVRQGVRFVASQTAMDRAARVADRLESIIGRAICDRLMFMGRLGAGSVPASRSTRLPLAKLKLR